MLPRLADRLAATALALLAAGPIPARAAEPVPRGAAFEAVSLAAGVHLLRPSGAGLDYANSLVVDRADGLLVIEAQPSPAAARELLDTLRVISSKPIRYLVLSHPHAEAAGGASAFPPETLVIGSAGCRDALADPAYDFAAELRAGAADPAAWVEPPRRRPTLVLRAPAELDDPARPVRLMVHAPAHSAGDLTVELPAQGIRYVGSLVWLDRVPYAGDADIGRWLGLLNAIIDHDPLPTVVGLRGPATDPGALVRLRDSFAWLRGQVEQGFADRLPHEEIARRVLATPGIGDRFAGDATFLPSLVNRAVDESAAHRRKRGRG